MTNLQNTDWRVIFNSKSYHSIFIENGVDKQSIKVVFDNWEEIEATKGFLIMLPTVSEYYNEDKSQYFKKFPQILKQFFDKKENKTLITDLDVFEYLIKEHSRPQIFDVIRKQNKNIVIFGNGGIEKYIPKDEYYVTNFVSAEEWLNNVEVFNRFDTIKETIKKAKNPFKDPFDSASSLLLDKD